MLSSKYGEHGVWCQACSHKQPEIGFPGSLLGPSLAGKEGDLRAEDNTEEADFVFSELAIPSPPGGQRGEFLRKIMKESDKQ